MTTETKTEAKPATNAEQRNLSSRFVIVIGIICLPVIALWGFGDSDSPKVSVNTQSTQTISLVSNSINPKRLTEASGSAVETSAQPASVSDETYRQLIVGTWETDRDGHRHLTVSEDGTAVMKVEIPGNWSLLFGQKMKFDIAWEIKDGVLTFETTGGEPKGKVDLITSMYGKQRVQQIKTLDETTMQLPDEDPESEDHVWTRVGPKEPGAL